jgi:hypothetical protein
MLKMWLVPMFLGPPMSNLFQVLLLLPLGKHRPQPQTRMAVLEVAAEILERYWFSFL